MEFASPQAVYAPTPDIHGIINLPVASTFDYLTNLYVLGTLLIVVIAMYTNLFSWVRQRRDERNLKDFGQVVDDVKKGMFRRVKKLPCNYEATAKPNEQELGTEQAVSNRQEFTRTVFDCRDWIRALGMLEFLVATGGFYGCQNTIQALWLSSSQPIVPEVVRQAITSVAEKTEVLQLCVRRRWFWPWFCRRTYIKVPFKVEYGDVMTIYYKLLGTSYNMFQGPLWRARLVSLPQTSVTRYEAVLMFTVHHCITDAFTNMIICRETLQVLNAAMTGHVYEPPFRAFTPFICDNLTTKSDWLPALKFALYKLYSPTLGNFNKNVYFHGTIPQPKVKTASTSILYQDLSVGATRNLLKYCKEEGVTVHSCIMTAATLAVFHSAQQLSDVDLEPATIKVMNCVNMRRYYPREYREATGCHISVEEQELVINGSDGSSKISFWSLARQSHASLQKSLLVDKNPIRNLLGLLPCSLLIPGNYSLTRNGRRNLNDSHMITTNMGDLRDLLPARYDHGPVEITKLLRCVSDELTGHPYTLIFHTFRDRLNVTLEYYSNKIAHDDAARYFSILTNFISDLAEHGSVNLPNDRKVKTKKNKLI